MVRKDRLLAQQLATTLSALIAPPLCGLNQTIFATIEEVQNTANEWQWAYINIRPNIVLDDITKI